VPAHVSTHSDTGIVCATVGEVSPILYVDLLGFKLHPDSDELISRLFHDVCESARMSYSCSMDNYLLTAMNSGLSRVGLAIWCRMYRELHLSSFIARCLCIYHYKYRPDFIRALPYIRVLSSSSDCKPVPLSGGSLLGFLSKIDCAVTVRVKYIFKSRWDKVARDVFAELEDGSLSGVRCEDVINVLDVAGVPVVALSDSKRYKLKGKLSRAALSDLKRRMRTTDEGKVVALSDSKRCKAKGKLSRAALSDSKRRIRTTDKGKISESGNKTVDKGTTSGGVTADPMSSSSSLQLQSELPSQPEPDSLPEGTVSSLPIVTESIPQTRVVRVISKSKASGSGDKAAGEGTTASGSGIVAVSPDNAGSSSPIVTETAPQVRIIRVISKSKASGSGDKATGEGTTASGSGIVAVSPDNAGSSSPIVTETAPQVRIIRVISKSKASGSGDKATG
ncbi:DUF4766 domain-containing protein, partial [Candidatus Ichthyocystis hellenicum]|uniref:DUF4766 domain-containing protein n=1 Tax=Candidatus Ichthyocystis hellenicum TaxID=1561003 RepID=UPI000AAE15DF